MENNQPHCPECEKLSGVAEQSNKLGDFLDWLKEDCGYRLCLFDESEQMYYPDFAPIEKLLAKYFEIDLDKVDTERMELLKWIQEKNNEKV